MASGAYAEGILDCLTGLCDLDTDSIVVALMNENHTRGGALKETDQNWDDVVADIYGGTLEQTLDAEAVAVDTALDQVEFTASAETFSAVALSGAETVESVVVFNDTPAADADKVLLACDDGGSGFGLTPNGSDIVWTPDATNGILYYDYGA